MSTDDIYRQVTLPGPSGTGRGGGRGEPPSWSARRTALSVLSLLVVVGGIFWWALPGPGESKWREPDGEEQLAGPAVLKTVDLPSTVRALEALDGWGRKSWAQKREATPVIAVALGLGELDYVAYIDVNHVVIREYLEARKQAELVRQAADGEDR